MLIDNKDQIAQIFELFVRGNAEEKDEFVANVQTVFPRGVDRDMLLDNLTQLCSKALITDRSSAGVTEQKLPDTDHLATLGEILWCFRNSELFEEFSFGVLNFGQTCDPKQLVDEYMKTRERFKKCEESEDTAMEPLVEWKPLVHDLCRVLSCKYAEDELARVVVSHWKESRELRVKNLLTLAIEMEFDDYVCFMFTYVTVLPFEPSLGLMSV